MWDLYLSEVESSAFPCESSLAPNSAKLRFSHVDCEGNHRDYDRRRNPSSEAKSRTISPTSSGAHVHRVSWQSPWAEQANEDGGCARDENDTTSGNIVDHDESNHTFKRLDSSRIEQGEIQWSHQLFSAPEIQMQVLAEVGRLVRAAARKRGRLESKCTNVVHIGFYVALLLAYTTLVMLAGKGQSSAFSTVKSPTYLYIRTSFRRTSAHVSFRKTFTLFTRGRLR